MWTMSEQDLGYGVVEFEVTDGESIHTFYSRKDAEDFIEGGCRLSHQDLKELGINVSYKTHIKIYLHRILQRVGHCLYNTFR